MGNHGGGIPKGSSAKAGSKGVGGNSADKGRAHGIHVGDHVMVRAGIRTGVKGKVKRLIGANHVHVVPKEGRAFIAHAKHLGTIRVGRGYVGV